MADSITGDTEVTATVDQIISARVQQVLTASMVAWPNFMDFSPEAGSGIDQVKIPRFGNFTVNSKAENTRVDAQTNAFSADNLDLDQHDVVQFLLEDIAQLQSRVAVQQEYVDQAASDLAAKMDERLLAALDSDISTSAPDHDVKYNDTSNNDMEKVDITTASQLLDTQNVPSDNRFAIIPPLKKADVLNIGDFVKVNESGSQQALRNGQMGQIFGFDMLVSTQLNTAGSSLFCHRSAAAVARQLLPKVESDRDLAHLSDRWSISHIYGYKVLDGGKRYVRFTET